MRPDVPVIDADNHYYEPDDAWTRHLVPAFADRAFHVRRGDDGIGRPYFGENPHYYLATTPVDKMGRPGAWVHDKDGRYQMLPEDDTLSPGQIPHFARRDARIEWMDTESIQATLLWPSMGLTVEHLMRDDPEACVANLVSFNRWLDDDWGFDYQHRIFGVPWITLIDLDAAIQELEHVLARGSRCVTVLFSPVGGRAIGDPYFDPFWARLAEAGVPLGLHGAESGYNELFSTAFGEPARPMAHEQSAFQRATLFERSIMDTMSSLVLHNVFGRHPGLQVICVENGSAWVPYLLRVMDHGARTGALGTWIGGRIDDLPSEIFKQHISIAPFDDDDFRGIIDLLGADRVLLGSDYPHPEGYPEPASMLDGTDLSAAELAAIAHDNAAKLLHLA